MTQTQTTEKKTVTEELLDALEILERNEYAVPIHLHNDMRAITTLLRGLRNRAMER